MLKQAVILFALAAVLLPRLATWYYSITIDTPDDEYDFIVVGAGIGGSVVASRLSENPNAKVLLLEAGDEQLFNYRISIPLLAALNYHTDVDWAYSTEPQSKACGALENRQSFFPRGKTLGGSSTINFLLFFRGSKYDYDAWQAMGATGWSYKDVLKYFKKSENAIPNNLTSDYRGKSGPLKISYPYYPQFTHEFIEAGKELGYHSGDYNGAELAGFHYAQVTVCKGQRQTAALAFLYPIASSRSNLDIVVRAHASKIILEKNKHGIAKATGIIYVRDGIERTIRAKKEVIVSGGAIGSPQLLMLSGIGPRNHLEEKQIETLVNVPGVGENLQDHSAIIVCWTANKLNLGDTPTMKSILFNYFFGDGGDYVNYAPVEAHAVIKTKVAENMRPDLHIVHVASEWNDALSDMMNYGEKHRKRMRDYTVKHDRASPCDFWTLLGVLRPYSAGKVSLKSNDYRDYPLINPNFLNDKRDVEVLVEGFKVLEKLEKTEVFQNMNAKMNLFFKEECGEENAPRSTKYYECLIKELSMSYFHGAGTAKIGKPDDPMAVVDPRLRVYNVKGLRIADASVMPDIPSANTQAPTYMVGEKAADMIKEDWNLI